MTRSLARKCSVPYVHRVFDGHAFADEGVAGNLAAPANLGVFLDFDESANLGVIANGATV